MIDLRAVENAIALRAWRRVIVVANRGPRGSEKPRGAVVGDRGRIADETRDNPPNRSHVDRSMLITSDGCPYTATGTFRADPDWRPDSTNASDCGGDVEPLPRCGSGMATCWRAKRPQIADRRTRFQRLFMRVRWGRVDRGRITDPPGEGLGRVFTSAGGWRASRDVAATVKMSFTSRGREKRREKVC